MIPLQSIQPRTARGIDTQDERKVHIADLPPEQERP